MNKDNAAAYLPLVQALSEGKVIEALNGDTNWEAETQLSFNMPPDRYRVRPEPRRFWIATTHTGLRMTLENITVKIGDHTTEGKIMSIIPVIEILDPKETP